MAKELAKNVAVVRADELERIKRSISGKAETELEGERRVGERQELYQKSQKRKENWGNTIEAIRKKKENERLRRFEEQEMERRKIDAEEAAIQEEARRAALERANKLLHDSADPVKALHSKMLLSDVLQERDMQLEIQRRKQDFQQEVEVKWQELETQQLQEYDLREAQKHEKEVTRTKEVRKVLKNQLDQSKQKMVRRIQEDMVEGELIKQKALDDLEAARREEQGRRQRAVGAVQEAGIANEYLKETKRQEREREMNEERKIAEFAKKKDEAMTMRKRREEEKMREKLAQRQKNIDRVAADLAGRRNNEQQRLDRQIEEAQSKATEEFQRKEQQKLQMMQQIEKSRQHQIARKLQEKTQEQKEEEEFKAFWQVRMNELAEIERQEKEDQRQRAVQLQHYHKKQMDYKARKLEQETAVEAELARQAEEVQQADTNQFNSYAEQCLKEWAAQGKNITPLILELKNYRKKVT